MEILYAYTILAVMVTSTTKIFLLSHQLFNTVMAAYIQSAYYLPTSIEPTKKALSYKTSEVPVIIW